MHGIILVELKMFVEAKLGAGAWDRLLATNEKGLASYKTTQSYPDSEVQRIVAAVSRDTHLPADAIFEDFGEFVAPHLLAMYPSLLSPEWRTLDVIEHTEQTIHAVVRQEHPDALPPYLRVHRTAPGEIVIFYDSPRKLCFIAKGIVKGLARQFGEVIGITERRCMHAGAPDCTLVISLEK
jgi:predicted hydrocarbon binding protein